MSRLFLRLRAPFAAFRWMQAGVYRATSPVIPPSAAWGLVLNLAGIETRLPGEATTLVRCDAPRLRLAIGRVGEQAEVATLYQQLHSYPVGNSGKELAPRAHGAKFWIVPVRREILVGFDALVGVETDDDGLLDCIRRGLRGELGVARYGLPFAGDNNLLFDNIAVVSSPPVAYWYRPMSAGDGPRRGSCRLTIAIDREDASRTRTALFAPDLQPTEQPDSTAWVSVGPTDSEMSA